jgi:beta-N-acetylhexosaminidase
MASRAFIAGCSGLVLTPEERLFFREMKPWGFILFKRNIDNPDQVRNLTADLRACTGRVDTPILVDQEGGRVQRLGSPHWQPYPSARVLAGLYPDNPALRREIVRLGARLIAHDLLDVGIDVDCLPVMDVPVPGAHDVIGNRAYGEDAQTVGLLGRAAAEGLIAGGVLPVFKHVPGHGRAGVDSHHELPVVNTSRAQLVRRDFKAFRYVTDMPMAMTAHVVYSAIDVTRPATTSKKVISSIVRRHIGFDGLLMSDDLSMKALGGSFAERTRAALSAGCDVVLHCNGVMAEMADVAEACHELSGKAKRRAEAALKRRPSDVEPLDVSAARVRLSEALAVQA